MWSRKNVLPWVARNIFGMHQPPLSDGFKRRVQFFLSQEKHDIRVEMTHMFTRMTQAFDTNKGMSIAQFMGSFKQQASREGGIRSVAFKNLEDLMRIGTLDDWDKLGERLKHVRKEIEGTSTALSFLASSNPKPTLHANQNNPTPTSSGRPVKPPPGPVVVQQRPDPVNPRQLEQLAPPGPVKPPPLNDNYTRIQQAQEQERLGTRNSNLSSPNSEGLSKSIAENSNPIQRLTAPALDPVLTQRNAIANNPSAKEKNIIDNKIMFLRSIQHLENVGPALKKLETQGFSEQWIANHPAIDGVISSIVNNKAYGAALKPYYWVKDDKLYLNLHDGTAWRGNTVRVTPPTLEEAYAQLRANEQDLSKKEKYGIALTQIKQALHDFSVRNNMDSRYPLSYYDLETFKALIQYVSKSQYFDVANNKVSFYEQITNGSENKKLAVKIGALRGKNADSELIDTIQAANFDALYEDEKVNELLVNNAPRDYIVNNAPTLLEELKNHLHSDLRELQEDNNKKGVLCPININGNHWVGVCVRYDAHNKHFNVDYIDTLFTEENKTQVENAVSNLANVMQTPFCLHLHTDQKQFDSVSCGIFVVDGLLSLANSGRLPKLPEEQNASLKYAAERRDMHMKSKNKDFSISLNLAQPHNNTINSIIFHPRAINQLVRQSLYNSYSALLQEYKENGKFQKILDKAYRSLAAILNSPESKDLTKIIFYTQLGEKNCYKKLLGRVSLMQHKASLSHACTTLGLITDNRTFYLKCGTDEISLTDALNGRVRGPNPNNNKVVEVINNDLTFEACSEEINKYLYQVSLHQKYFSNIKLQEKEKFTSLSAIKPVAKLGCLEQGGDNASHIAQPASSNLKNPNENFEKIKEGLHNLAAHLNR